MRSQLRVAYSRSTPALAFWVLAGLLVWLAPARSGDLPTPSLSPPQTTVDTASVNDSDSALRKALELERRHNWSEAIKAYEEALERWPERVDFRHRLRLCESHYWLGRRYQDRSFRDTLLQLNHEKSFELFAEVIERIESHYVEPVAFEPLLRRGLDNLEVALRDPRFLQANAPQADPERVLWLRRTCSARRQNLVARNPTEAVAVVQEICGLAHKAISLSTAPVVLEFTYGACDALDDYTLCLSPAKLDDLYAVIDGNFVGLGVELKADDAGLLLVGVIPGGPAAEAGL
ncbi:MAG TPA: peptidase S41, partial [Isosphaeraceae bacterium]|nr:peptidase S41 [Isosphaeraceae bacterium]